MKQVIYKVFDFDYQKIYKGDLCIIVRKNAKYNTIIDGESQYQTISNVVVDKYEHLNPDLKGAGICRFNQANSRFVITINGTVYQFNDKGVLQNSEEEWYLRPAEIIVEILQASEETTRSGSKLMSTTSIVETKESITEELKDTIALQVLKEILSRLDTNPAETGDNEITYYCLQSYRWAEKMVEIKKTTEQ